MTTKITKHTKKNKHLLGTFSNAALPEVSDTKSSANSAVKYIEDRCGYSAPSCPLGLGGIYSIQAKKESTQKSDEPEIYLCNQYPLLNLFCEIPCLSVSNFPKKGLKNLGEYA